MKINALIIFVVSLLISGRASPVLSAETAPKVLPITTVEIIKRVSTSDKGDSESLFNELRKSASSNRVKFMLGDGSIAELSAPSSGSERISIYPSSPGIPTEVSFWAAGVPGTDSAAGEFPCAEMKLVRLDKSNSLHAKQEVGQFYRIDISLRTAKWKNSSFQSLVELENVRLKSEGLDQILNGMGVLTATELKNVLIKNSGSSRDWDPELGWSAVRVLPRGLGEITVLNFRGTKGCARLDQFLERNPDFQYVGNSSGFKWISKDQTKTIRPDPDRPGCIGQILGGRKLQQDSGL